MESVTVQETAGHHTRSMPGVCNSNEINMAEAGRGVEKGMEGPVKNRLWGG